MEMDVLMLWVFGSAIAMWLIPGLIALAITLRHDRDPSWKLEPLSVEPMDQAEIYNFEEYAREVSAQARSHSGNAANIATRKAA
jgi:hypothetical protein